MYSKRRDENVVIQCWFMLSDVLEARKTWTQNH